MLPDRVSNPGSLTYESGALPIALRGPASILIITIGHNFLHIEHGVTVLALCTSSDHGLYLYQVLPKYLERVKSYGANTISLLIITKGYNSPNIAHGVTVLVLYTLSKFGEIILNG